MFGDIPRSALHVHGLGRGEGGVAQLVEALHYKQESRGFD